MQPNPPNPSPHPDPPKPTNDPPRTDTLDAFAQERIVSLVQNWISQNNIRRPKRAVVDDLCQRIAAFSAEHASWRVADAKNLHAAGRTVMESELTKLRNQVANRTKEHADLSEYVRKFRSHVELAVRVLTRSTRQKKKAPALRAARGTLEAALSEPEPLSWSILSAVAIGGMAIFGILGTLLRGGAHYSQSKAATWTSQL